MRHFVQTFRGAKFPPTRFLRGVGSGDATIPSASSGRCYHSLASKNSCIWNSSRPHICRGNLDLPTELAFLSRCGSAVFSSRSGSGERPDPFARRPTSKCDPYGQSGKPLTLDAASALLRTVEPEWKLRMRKDDDHDDSGGEADNDMLDNSEEDETTFVPFAISRVYWHEDYMLGAKFCSHVAAVAQMNAQHFPHQVTLSRKLESRTKTWKICTQIVCRTHVLQGLSHHDFYLATLIDIEAQRPEVRGLLADGQ